MSNNMLCQTVIGVSDLDGGIPDNGHECPLSGLPPAAARSSIVL
jgi:hypothetical protein